MSPSSHELWTQSAKAFEVSRHDLHGNRPEEVEKRSELYTQLKNLRIDCITSGKSFDDAVNQLLDNPPEGYDVMDVLETVDIMDMTDSMPDNHNRTKPN